MIKSTDPSKILKKIKTLDKFDLNKVVNADQYDILKLLFEKEKEVDNLIIKKRMEIQESLTHCKSNLKIILRIHISYDYIVEEKCFWKMKIMGKILGLDEKEIDFKLINNNFFTNILKTLKVSFKDSFYNNIEVI